MDTSVTLLYRDYAGYVDNEANDPNGVEVRLTYWHSSEWKITSHYMLETFLMVDGDLLLHHFEIFDNFSCDTMNAHMIRKAIEEFEKLNASHPKTLSLER